MKDQEPIKFVSLKNISTPLGVHFFFTTRHGGESKGVYGGLNLGLHVADDPLRVQNNRQALLKALSPSVQDLVFINQVHGTTTLIAPLEKTLQQPADADALVTGEKNIAIGVMTADCVPVLFADVENQVVGAAHAGWRGAAAGILESCIGKMQELGAEPEKIFAVIGPAIHQPNYAVGSSFRDSFLDHGENKNRLGCQKFFSSSPDKSIVAFDLPGYVRDRLLWNRIPSEKIVDVGLCTYHFDNQFFSHRRTTSNGGNLCGRQMGGIYLC